MKRRLRFMNPKTKTLFITVFTMICAAIAFVFASSHIGKFGGIVGANDTLKEMIFNGDNHSPSMEPVNVMNTHNQKFDYNGNVDANGGIQLHYTKCKYNTNQPSYHVRLISGTVEKTDETYDLRTFTVTFGGSDSSGQPYLRLYHSIEDANSDYSLETAYKEIKVTSGTAYDAFGYNYWKIISSGTTNVSFSYTFGCVDKSIIEDVEVELNDNFIFYEGGRMPRKSDFDVTITYNIGGTTYERIGDVGLLDIDVPSDFLTNGGDIDWSYYGFSGTTSNSRNPVTSTGKVTRYEAEDSTITGATAVTQLKEYPHDESTGNIKSGELVKDEHYRIDGAGLVSANELMLACAYLDYDAESGLKSSSSEEADLGGLVTYMDKSRNGKMVFTVEAESSTYYALTVRGASNKEQSTGSSTLVDLYITENDIIKVNGGVVSSRLDDQAKFPGSTNTSSDPNNRNYTAGYGLNMRYRYIHWATAELGAIYLSQGTNTIEIIGNSQSAGNWDYIELTELSTTSDGIYECESAVLSSGTHYIRQISNNTDYTTFTKNVDYIDTCNYGELHAKAYLGYQGTRYGSHGSNGDLGGFVHYFGSGSTMTFTIESEKDCVRELIVRGSTNYGANTANHTIGDLRLSTNFAISVNGEDLSIDSTLYFHGKSDTTPDATANRTGTVSGSSLVGRYVYLLWEDISLGEIELHQGTNTIVIRGKTNNGGHWDYIKLV